MVLLAALRQAANSLGFGSNTDQARLVRGFAANALTVSADSRLALPK
jgi:hypothetical protein